MKDKISVIVPCYRVENYIDRCLDSLKTQTYGMENLEIILIDDASEDDTRRRLLQFEEEHSENVLVIVCEDNAGPGTTRNLGLNYATGEYIAFVDADDIVDKSMFERMHGVMKEFGVDMAECGYRTFFDGEELSVENLLQSTPEPEVESISVEEWSETRKMIEKFVDENPEAVANLLRNWLNEDWG